MPAFTATADATANTLTATGVAAAGQPEGAVVLTGDRLRVRNVGGALPSPLTAVTDYYAVRLSDNVIQLSDTNAHALAGTNIIDLTTTGSGTNTIEFSLPYCLPTAIAGPGVQARSSIFNAMYNSLVALYCLLTGQSQSIFTGVRLAGPLTVGGDVYGVRTRQVIPTAWGATGTAPTLVANPGAASLPLVWKLPTAQTVRTRIPIEPGETITSVTCEVYGDGAVDWVGNVTSFTSSSGSGSETVASNGSGVTNQSAAWSMEALGTADVGPQLSGANVMLEVVLSGGTQLYLGVIEVGVRRLPS